MAISDQALQSFFLKQKKASVEDLLPSALKKEAQKLEMNSVKTEKSPGPSIDSLSNLPVRNSEINQDEVAAKLVPSLEVLDSSLKEQQTSTKERFFKSEEASDDGIDEIIGKERILLFYVFKKCQSLRALETPAITTEELITLLNVSSGHLRNIIFRLTKKFLLKVSEFKVGRVGWRKFKISEEIFRMLSLDENSVTACESKANEDSLYINKTDIEDKKKSLEKVQEEPLSDEWNSIDIEGLRSIGFTKSHLNQLVEGNKLSPSVLQDSIYAFAFDLEHNGREKTIKGSPLNLIMGILRNGNPYVPPANYESPRNRALRLYLEKKKADEEKRLAMEKELSEIHFKEWSDLLTVSEKEKLLPEGVSKQKVLAPKTAYLRTYYRDNIWPEKRKEILNFSKNSAEG